MEEKKNNNDKKNQNNNNKGILQNLKPIDIFLMNIEYIIKYFEEHNEQNSCHFQNFENWISLEKYPKLFHQYDIFYEQIKQPLFRKSFIMQLLIVLNSFITPINKCQKDSFKFSQNQKENIINLIRKCILYLHEKYNIFFYDIIKNENKWSKWKENSCPEIEKIINNKKEKENVKKNEKENKEENKEKDDIQSKIINIKSKFSNYNLSFIDDKSEFSKNINELKETKINDIKFSSSIERINSECVFFGAYLEQIFKDLDPENDEENNKERVFNNVHWFSWKFLRLLAEGDLNKINTEEKYKLLSISEDFYKQFADKNSEIKIDFHPIPPPKIELKLKEEIFLPEEVKNSNNDNKNKPFLSLPKEIISDNNNNDNLKNTNNNKIKNLSYDNENTKEFKEYSKKEEIKEKISLSNIKKSNDEIKESKKEEASTNIIDESNKNNNISQNILPPKENNIDHPNKLIEIKEKINVNNIIKNEPNKQNININNLNNNNKKEEETIKNKQILNNNINNIDISDKNEKKQDNKIEVKEKEITNEKEKLKDKEKAKEGEIILNNNHNNQQSSNNIIIKEKEANNKDNKEIKENRDFKEMKIQKTTDSRIPIGITNISKDKSEISDKISFSFKDIKNDNNKININNKNSKEINISQDIDNNLKNNKDLKENNNNINKNNNNNINKNNQNGRNDKNTYYNNNSKNNISSNHNLKSSDSKNLLNNTNSTNKSNINSTNNNKMIANSNNNNIRYDKNRYENNNRHEKNYNNKSDNKHENNKGNYNYDKYKTNYDNRKNNSNYNNRKYDNNQDYYYINKKRKNDDQYDYYYSSSKKRK